MSSASAYLAALQLSDSALPIGRFVHSHGLESWLATNGEAGDAELAGLIEAALISSVAPLDGAIVSHAHRAPELTELLELDRLTTARKLTPASRSASESCGRALAGLAVQLSADPVVHALAAAVAQQQTAGNLVVVEGALARALGLSCRAAVLLELRGYVAGLLSCAVRLGRSTAFAAQRLMTSLGPAIESAGDIAETTRLDALATGSPELEIHAMRHQRADARTFRT